MGLTARWLLPLAKDFVKRPDFREIQIPSGAPHLPVRSDVLGPGVPGHELVGLDAEIFQPQNIFERLLFFGSDLAAQFDEARLLAGQSKSETIRAKTEIIPYRAVERDFLDG